MNNRPTPRQLAMLRFLASPGAILCNRTIANGLVGHRDNDDNAHFEDDRGETLSRGTLTALVTKRLAKRAPFGSNGYVITDAGRAFVVPHAGGDYSREDLQQHFDRERTNHDEAYLLAQMKAPESNVARCYLDARKLIERVARLNPDAGEIGAGMLASLVADAREIVGDGSQD